MHLTDRSSLIYAVESLVRAAQAVHASNALQGQLVVIKIYILFAAVEASLVGVGVAIRAEVLV